MKMVNGDDPPLEDANISVYLLLIAITIRLGVGVGIGVDMKIGYPFSQGLPCSKYAVATCISESHFHSFVTVNSAPSINANKYSFL